jgi:hypothetical protein
MNASFPLAGKGSRLLKFRRAIPFGDEQLQEMRLQVEQFLGDPADFRGVFSVLKQRLG